MRFGAFFTTEGMNMSDKITVAESIRRVAVMFQNMVEAADMLESIGSLEQAKKEADAARVAAEAARNSSIVEAEKVAQTVNAAKTEAAELIADAKFKASDLEVGAHAKADAIIADAQRAADAIVADSAGAASQAVAEMTAQIVQMRLTLATLTEEVAKAKTDKEAAEADTDAAQARLASIQEAIRKLAAV